VEWRFRELCGSGNGMGLLPLWSTEVVPLGSQSQPYFAALLRRSCHTAFYLQFDTHLFADSWQPPGTTQRW
jgi:hypothetical protein